MKALAWARGRWARTSLASRMVVLIISLLAVGLLIAGTVMVGVLQRHLVNQVDEQLEASAQQLASDTSNQLNQGQEPNVPTDFYIRIQVAGKATFATMTQETRQRSGVPVVGELLQVGQVANTSTGMSHPITVRSTKKGQTWRAVAVPMQIQSTGQPVGVVTVALPLTHVSQTLANTASYFLFASCVILALGGFLAYYLVRRSLSPLRTIETVAGHIAAGDLSQRIEPAPPSTEVGSLALSLNTMLSQIERSFEARQESEQKMRRFVSDASHELRTPLAAIRGYGELYRMGGVPAERVRDVMGRIESEATRMSSLVESLLTLARLDEGRKLTFTDVDVVKLLDNASFDLQALDPDRPVKVKALSGRRPPMTLVVQADRDQLAQVFTNLIGNIDRYTPNGSPVELAVGHEGRTAIVEFRDHGPGIEPKDQQRVFERFYRTDNSRARKKGGSGLGLSIVAAIMGAHRGTARLSRTAGGGLTVHLELPLRQPGAPDASPRPASGSGAPTASSSDAASDQWRAPGSGTDVRDSTRHGA